MHADLDVSVPLPASEKDPLPLTRSIKAHNKIHAHEQF